MMTTDTILAYVLGVTYLVAHLSLYVAYLRRKRRLSSERGIFQYHFLSGCTFSLLLLALSAIYPTPHTFAVAAGLIALHGIYSMTFLEFWSLTQGSYSIQIMRKVRLSDALPTAVAIRELSLIGEQKRQERLQALLDLGLLRQESERLVPTSTGHLAARGLRMLLYFTNYQESG